MYYSRTAQSTSPRAPELLAALSAATDAVVMAQAADFGSVEIALERLESATSMLTRAELPLAAHAAVRSEIDRAGLVTKRLFEAMVVERDRLGAELSRSRLAVRIAPERTEGLDLSI